MKTMTAEELQQKIADNQEVHMIDVRETKEVESGKIPGATNIPLGLLEFRLQDLSKEKPYIIICRSGGRSSQAAQLLDEHGYDATNLTGGMLGWNGPVE